MRIGPLEIITIIIIILAIAFIARIARIKAHATAQNKEPTSYTKSQRVNDNQKKTRDYLRRLGIAFIVAGIFLILAVINMFRWAVQGYVWAFVAMILGILFLFISRKAKT